jgi:heme exporter protein D
MMNLGPHASFIITAYATAGIILALLIGWVVTEHRSLKRTLSDLDARGVTRRSEPRKPDTHKSEPRPSAA